jgi:hypothetical protein
MRRLIFSMSAINLVMAGAEIGIKVKKYERILHLKILVDERGV